MFLRKIHACSLVLSSTKTISYKNYILGGPQGAPGMQGMPPGAGGPNQQGGNFFGGNGPPMGAPSGGGAMGST